MFHLAYKIPKDKTVNIAFSGGIDSLATALLYKRMGYDVNLHHFHHGCEYSDGIASGCINLAKKLELDINVGYNDSPVDEKKSLEDQWRRARYRFLYSSINDDSYVVTAHHLNDSVETWIWSSMHGNGKIIEPHQSVKFENKTVNLVRPMLLSRKSDLEAFIDYHGYEPVEDAYNKELGLTRNYIRHVMMPHVLKVNPGIEKVIRKKYLSMKK